MIETNIRRFRKKAGLSQDELAVKLSVVRQTVSKWENGLSVPDAEMVIRMAQVLGVSVNQLLGAEFRDESEDLAEQLAQANALLAQKNQALRLMKAANQKRGLLLFLSVLAVLLSMAVKNPVLSPILTGLCLLAALVVLYRNLALLTQVTTENADIRPLKIVTILNIGLLLGCAVFSALAGAGLIRLSEKGEQLCAMFLVAAIMIISGLLSPKLPFNRHTGLRLPWTVQDEETWNLAHRILGYTAVPTALFYLAGALAIGHLEAVTLAAMAAWIGIPALISYRFFRRKTHGKR